MRIWEVDRSLLQDFVRANNPIKLTFDDYFNGQGKEQLDRGDTNGASGKLGDQVNQSKAERVH
jgi:hypothetical protein